MRAALAQPSAGAVDVALAALKRISEGDDAPDIDVCGEWQLGLHCGVEDRDCRDRYQGADYGHTVGVERTLEWASNEAKLALEQMSLAPQPDARDAAIKRVAAHMEMAVDYINRAYPTAPMLDRRPIIRNMTRWATTLRAASAATQPSGETP